MGEIQVALRNYHSHFCELNFPKGDQRHRTCHWKDAKQFPLRFGWIQRGGCRRCQGPVAAGPHPNMSQIMVVDVFSTLLYAICFLLFLYLCHGEIVCCIIRKIVASNGLILIQKWQ